MGLKFATLHEIQKEANNKNVILKKRNQNLDVNSNEVQIITSTTRNALNEKNSKKVFGLFNNSKFPDRLNHFLNSSQKEIAFELLCKKTLINLRHNMLSGNKYVTSTGGYILFFIYESDITHEELFYTVVFKQNSGIAIDDNLDVKESIYVDLKKIQQAIIINLTQYVLEENDLEEIAEDDKGQFIRFISKGVTYSDYFIETFSCSNNIKPNKVTKSIILGLERCFIEQSNDAREILNLIQPVKRRIIGFLRKNIDSDLNTLKEIISAELNANADNIDGKIPDIEMFSKNLINYLQEEYQVPFYFRVDKSELKKYSSSKIEGDNKKWTLTMDNNIVGIIYENSSEDEINQAEQKKIKIDTVNKCILIQDVSGNKLNSLVKNIREN